MDRNVDAILEALDEDAAKIPTHRARIDEIRSSISPLSLKTEVEVTPAGDQTRGSASAAAAQPPVAPNERRFQNDSLIVTVDSVGFSRDTSGSYISLSVNFENRSAREELLMCVRRALVDDQAREWGQSQGTGLATIRVGYNYDYGPNGVAYSLGYHTTFSPRVQQAALMRFTRNGSPTAAKVAVAT